MKKLLIVCLIFGLLSCSGSKTIRQSQKTIKGQWILDSINYSEVGTYNISLFNDASKVCFEQSTWQFIPNNYTGFYNIDKYNCSSGDRPFNFFIEEIDKTTGLYNFLLKPTDALGKSETNQGFRLTLTKLSDNGMQWQQIVAVDGKPFTINMNFSKL